MRLEGRQDQRLPLPSVWFLLVKRAEGKQDEADRRLSGDVGYGRLPPCFGDDGTLSGEGAGNCRAMDAGLSENDWLALTQSAVDMMLRAQRSPHEHLSGGAAIVFRPERYRNKIHSISSGSKRTIRPFHWS